MNPETSPTTQIWPALIRLADSILLAARSDETLRGEITRFMQAIDSAIQPVPESIPKPQPVEAQESGEPSEKPPQKPTEETAPIITVLPETVSAITAALETKAERTDVPSLVSASTPETSDQELIAECRIKAEACRWNVERRKLMGDYFHDVKPKDEDLIVRAKQLRNCFLWMANPNAPASPSGDGYIVLAECFENAAASLELLDRVLGDSEPDLLESTLVLVAEAQSAIRVAVGNLGTSEPDFTQDQIFRHLRRLTSEMQVFVPRYMTRADAADPENAEDLRSRIAGTKTALDEASGRKKKVRTSLGTIRFHARKLHETDQRHQNWSRILDTIEEAVPKIIAPSNAELRDLLLPTLETLPEDLELTTAASAVFEAIDQFLANQPVEEEKLHKERPTAEVAKVRARLKETTLVVIGGQARPYAREALRAAFDLSDVVWITTREHESPENFKVTIQSTGVSAVILAIRWSSHVFANVKSYCDEAGVAFIRLPGGYSPNQVAHQILAQHPNI